MILTFRWTQSDYASARYSWSLHHPWRLFVEFPEGVGYSIAGLLLAIFILIVSRYQDNAADWQGAYDLVVGSLLLCGLPCFLGFRWRVYREYKRKFSLRPDATARIDEQGVELSCADVEKSHLWVGFTKIYESRRVVVMDLGGKDFIFLPKDAMSAAQLEEFKRLATTRALQCAVTIASP
jgi:hypothetical protein